MKKLCLAIFMISVQTSLISAQISMGKVQIHPSEFLDTLFSDRLGTCCSPDSCCPAYDYISFVQNGFRHKDGQCEIYLYNTPIGMARTIKRHEDMFPGAITQYNRLKDNFKWGNPEHLIPSKQDKLDMDMLITWLPKRQAKKLFNADCAGVFPMNFKGRKCRNKFSWGRGVVFISGSGLCYLYFIFTDEARAFEEYLKEIKGIFILEDCKVKKEPML